MGSPQRSSRFRRDVETSGRAGASRGDRHRPGGGRFRPRVSFRIALPGHLQVPILRQACRLFPRLLAKGWGASRHGTCWLPVVGLEASASHPVPDDRSPTRVGRKLPFQSPGRPMARPLAPKVRPMNRPELSNRKGAIEQKGSHVTHRSFRARESYRTHLRQSLNLSRLGLIDVRLPATPVHPTVGIIPG